MQLKGAREESSERLEVFCFFCVAGWDGETRCECLEGREGLSLSGRGGVVEILKEGALRICRFLCTKEVVPKIAGSGQAQI